MSLSLEGYSDDEVVRIQRKYIDATLKVGDDQIEAKDAWIAKSIYILVARRFI
jgi:hypothetical protein